MVSARLCSTCGAELDSGAMFCAECGARVTAVPPSPVVPYPHAAAPYTPLPPVPSSGPVAPAPGPLATSQPPPGPHAAPVAPAPGGPGLMPPPPPAAGPTGAGATAAGPAGAAPAGAVPPGAVPGAAAAGSAPAGSMPTSALPTSVAPTSAAPTSVAPTGVAPTSTVPAGGVQAGSPRTVAAPAARGQVRGGEAFPVVPGSVAPVGRRVAAFAIDGAALLLLGGVGVAITFATAGEPEVSPASVAASFVPSALAGLGGLALWVSESITGATLGGALLGIRTVSAETGRPAGLLRILLRQLVVGLGALVCLVGQWLVVASGVFDKTPAQRGWHDKAAGTIVLLASATGVARAEDPARAWDQAVARAVGPVPPPPPPPAPPAPAAPAVHEPTVPAVAPAATVAPAPSSPAATGSGALEVPPAIGLVPLPPGVGTGRPSQQTAGGALITGFPGATESAAPAPTTGTSEPLSGDAMSATTLGDTPPAGHERVEPTAPLAGATSGEHAAQPSPLPHTEPSSTQLPSAQPSSTQPDSAQPSSAQPSSAQPSSAQQSPVPRWSGDEVDEIELTRLRTPAAGMQPVPQGLRLAFDTGERLDVLGDGVVGRAPQGDVTHVVAIDDPARSLSKTHLAFGPAGPGELWVMDRGSTNGTVVVRPDGTAASLPAGTRATVTVGWSLRIGERTVRVESR